MSWERLSKHIGQRSSEQLSDVWGTSTETPGEPTLSELLPSLIDTDEFVGQELNTLVSTPGVVQNAFQELIKLRKKFYRATNLSEEIFSQHSLVWGTVDHFNANIITVKYLLGLNGIFYQVINGYNLICDVFPQFVAPQRSKSYKTESESFTSPIRLLSYKGNKLDHNHFFQIVKRVCSIASSEAARDDLNFISNFNFKRFKSRRNLVIYDPIYWEPSSDLVGPPSDIGSVAASVFSSQLLTTEWLDSPFADVFFAMVFNRTSRLLETELGLDN